jgi:hypothetical protein
MGAGKPTPPSNWKRRKRAGYVIGILSPTTGKLIWIPLKPDQGGKFEYEAGLHGLSFKGTKYKDRTRWFGAAVVRLTHNNRRTPVRNKRHSIEAVR